MSWPASSASSRSKRWSAAPGAVRSSTRWNRHSGPPGRPSTQSGWARAAGPDRRIDGPVAEGTAVVATAEEPAVVEHEALDAHAGGGVDEGLELLERLVEVDRLPRVEDDRPRSAGDRRP